MMNYFEIQFYDNDSYLLEVSKVDRHKYKTCSTCKLILNKRTLIESHLPKYKVKRKKYHLSCSYDGFKVVSQDFKHLYESSKWQGLVFYAITKSKGFYLVECTEIVEINESKSTVVQESKCADCGLYMGTYMKGFVSLNSSDIQRMKPNTFYRSNLEFGNDFEKGYSIFASEEITNTLIDCKLIVKKDLIEVKSVD